MSFREGLSTISQGNKLGASFLIRKVQLFLLSFISSIIIPLAICGAAGWREMVTYTSKPWLFFVLLLVLSYYRACFSIAGDTLSTGQPLSVRKTIVSEGGNFVLSFFRPGTSSKIYLGIWYNDFDVKDVVWVANRENPLSEASSSRLELSEDGNLVLLEGSSKIPFWSTNLPHPLKNSTEAVLHDDGNFVLRDSSNQSTIFWESFDHPTDTWLPGGKLGIDKITGKSKQLISWKNSKDPATGVFSFGLDSDRSSQLILEWNRSQKYWSSGFWTGKYFSLFPEIGNNKIFNFIFVSNENESYFTYSVSNSSFRFKFIVNSSGEIQQLAWLAGPLVWNLLLSQPTQLSDVFSFCGAFGVYHESSPNPCECLEFFEPFSIEDTRLDDWSGGCVRKDPLKCGNSTYANGKKDEFMQIKNMRLPVNAKEYMTVSRWNCEAVCLNNCSCTAYAYNGSVCMMWEGALLNLQQLSYDGGQHIYVKIAAYQHQSTKGRIKKNEIYINLCYLNT
jgi:hypothetical protein